MVITLWSQESLPAATVRITEFVMPEEELIFLMTLPSFMTDSPSSVPARTDPSESNAVHRTLFDARFSSSVYEMIVSVGV